MKPFSLSTASHRDHRTWKKPGGQTSSLSPDSPHLTVQRFTLMIRTLLLMSKSSWRRLNIHIANEIIRSKMNGNVKRRVAFSLKCHCPFLLRSWWESGKERGPPQLHFHEKRCWGRLRKTLQRRKWCLHQWHLYLVFFINDHLVH